VNFSRDSNLLTKIRFENKVALFGGAGFDTFANSLNNQFLLTGNFTDFDDPDPLP
jgi:hypothetical protein